MNIDSDQPFRLFVYGTLLPGQGNYRLIERHVRSTRPATIQGVLVDLGAFPALILGEGIVKGMLLELDDKAMAITDRLEGFHPGDDQSLYLRKEVIVQLDDGQEVQAWTYESANPSAIGDRRGLAVGRQCGTHVHAWQNSCGGSVDL